MSSLKEHSNSIIIKKSNTDKSLFISHNEMSIRLPTDMLNLLIYALISFKRDPSSDIEIIKKRYVLFEGKEENGND